MSILSSTLYIVAWLYPRGDYDLNKHESTQHEDALKQETAWGFTRC